MHFWIAIAIAFFVGIGFGVAFDFVYLEKRKLGKLGEEQAQKKTPAGPFQKMP